MSLQLHQLHQLHLLKYLKKIKSPNKCIKSTKIITQNKKNQEKVEQIKTERIMFKRIQMLIDERDNHLLIIKTKQSNDKNNKLSTRKIIKVETKSNQFVKRVYVIESSSES